MAAYIAKLAVTESTSSAQRQSNIRISEVYRAISKSFITPAKSRVMWTFLLLMMENQYKNLQSEAEVCQM